ncbi:MarR family transcriptional regulator [Panacagrimonas perspica]|uniref:MarR family winged helix-turn-helix transcriptional regulator n=1 Tax=Panacagrimonas perspica TaxID=381431 RepID=UPI0010A08EC0|nr:MarR family transcriptional regulator [Panacagrimonas perspica]THD00532.1 MarR family transcriptional regulator [Panacagrimonas perspica]
MSGGELGFLVSAARSAIWNSIEAELQSLDITAAQFVVFNSIALGKGRTIGEFCRLLGYDSGAMTRLLDRIEKKGLIRRVANPEDRRSFLLELTPESRAVFPQAKKRVQAVFKRLLAGFDEKQAAALRQSLEQVLANAAGIS